MGLPTAAGTPFLGRFPRVAADFVRDLSAYATKKRVSLVLAESIDVFEIERFIALNLYEIGKFAADGRRVAISEFVNRYNDIIDDVETDPSLKIEFR